MRRTADVFRSWKKVPAAKPFALSGLSLLFLLASAQLFSQEFIAGAPVAKEEVLRKIPLEYIHKARRELVIAYQHTSHGTHVSRGMYGLQDYKEGDTLLFGISLEPADDSLEFRDEALAAYAPPGVDAADLSRVETAFIQTTRNYLDAPENDSVNVVMWSWCDIAGHDVANVYLPGMDSLISEYGPGGSKIGTGVDQREKPVTFIRMTGHANVNANVGDTLRPKAQADTIVKWSVENQQYCLDYYSIDTHDMDDNYWEDAGDDGNSAAYGGNFYRDWQNAHTLGEHWYENKVLPGGRVDYGEHNTQHITANRKAYAMWWILARIAGWDGDTAAKVLVTDIEVSSRDDITEVATGDTLRFFAEVFPDSASMPEVTWSVINDSGTAVIDQLGLLTAGDSGRVTVVASAQDTSGVADSLAIHIYTPFIPVEDVSIRTAGDVDSLETLHTLQFTADVLPANATTPELSWSVINEVGTASIDANGLLTAGDTGMVAIVAQALDGSGVADTFDLKIYPPPVLVEQISISSAGGISTVESGWALQFSAEVLPVDADNPAVSWEVVNGTGTATITTDGLLIAGDPGSVDIRASAQDGSGVDDTFTLTIIPPIILVEEIIISSAGDVSSVETGSTLQFSAEVLPANASNQELAWSIINLTGTASIDANGLLTAGNPGTVQVMAEATDESSVTDIFNLEILPPPVLVESITISSAGGISTLQSGSILQFSASILPEDATNKHVQWSVSNGAGSAFINAAGLLTAGIPGTVEVLATAMDGSGIISAPFTLSITAPPIPISSIEVSAEGGLSELESGQSLQFSANIVPQDASNPYLLWTINALSGTASISAQGLLTAGDPGEVEVVASAQDGSGITDSYLLNILPAVIDVQSIQVYSAGNVSEVDEGDMLQLYATVNPSDASNKEIFWHVTSSGQDAVGSITADGMFIALREGQVDALAIAQDGSGVYGTLSLTVMGQGPNAVEEITPVEEIKLYPNPTQGLLFIDKGAMEVVRLRVIDMHGALVLEQLPEPGHRILEADLSQQAPGIYYVQVFSEKDYLVKAVIINR